MNKSKKRTRRQSQDDHDGGGKDEDFLNLNESDLPEVRFFLFLLLVRDAVN